MRRNLIELLECPKCGATDGSIVLLSRCVHVHQAGVTRHGVLEWETFTSDDCEDGDPPGPVNRLHCKECDWGADVTLDGEQERITEESLNRAMLAASGLELATRIGERP